MNIFCFPDLSAEQRLLAVGRERTGQRHAEADLDRFFVLRLRAGHGEHRTGGQRKAGAGDPGICP
jgi:hypothetical protein